MRQVIRLRQVAILFISALSIFCSAVAQTQQPAAFQIEESGAIKITPEEGAKLELLSKTAKPLMVTVKLVDGKSKSPVPFTQVMQVVLQGKVSETVRLSPADNLLIEVGLRPGANPEPGSYEGYLVAFESTTNTVERRKVTLKVPQPGAKKEATKPAPGFLVKSWNIEIYKGFPQWLWPLDKNEPIPLSAGTAVEETSLKSGEILSHLVSDKRDTALVRWRGEQAALLEDTVGLKLSVESLDSPGVYEGKIDLASKDDTDKVALKITVAHHIIYALLALAAGILLALWLQRFLGVLRSVWEFKERQAQLGIDFAEADKVFKELSRNKPFKKFHLTDFNQNRDDLLPRINRLKRNFASKLDEKNPDYQAVKKGLESLEGRVKDWTAFAQKLGSLYKAYLGVNTASASRPPYLEPRPEKPVVYCKSYELLTSTGIKVAEFEKVSKEVEARTKLLEQWSKLNSQASALWPDIEKLNAEDALSQMDEIEKVDLATAKTSLQNVWHDLWNDDDYLAEAIIKDLSSIEEILSRLRQYIPVRHTASNAYARRRALQIAAAELDEERSLEDDIARVEAFRGLRRYWDVAFITIAVIIALYTGLKTLYFGQGFGTCRDYINALIWGFTTETVVASISAGIERVWSLRWPLN
jgi:hypothetical protein